MAEQPVGEKVLPATPRKIEQARDKGNVPKSQDLNSAVMLLAAILSLSMMGPLAFNQLLGITQYYFRDAHILMRQTDNMQGVLVQGLYLVVPVILPTMLVLMVGGFAINVAQFGFLFSAQAIQPKLEKLDPIKGFQRYFSMRTLVELIKSLAKLTLVAWIVYLTLRSRVPELLTLTQSSPMGVGVSVWGMIFAVWWRISMAMLVVGIMDYGFQRWQHGQDLRMTNQEMKEEMKQLEGDPQIRQRVRQIQRQMAMQRMMKDVPDADVIITNPTTYAIALRYKADEMDAPMVIAKGARIQAERIRTIAVENDIPIVERPELARTMFRTVEVGQAVSEDIFRAVAEVLAYIYEIDRREEKIQERQQAGARVSA